LKRDFEVYGVAGGGLDSVIVENGVLVRLEGVFGVEARLTAYNGKDAASISSGTSIDIRSILTPILEFLVRVLW
jgi:hypothetical protein